MKVTKSGFSLVELFVAMAIISILMSLMLSGVMVARESARRIACSNQIRQLGLAMDQHHLAWNALPPGTSSSAKNLCQGWPAYLLPYLGESPLWQEIQGQLAISPNLFNAQVHPQMAHVLPHLVCPSDEWSGDTRISARFQIRVGLTSYLACSGTNASLKDGAFGYDKGRKYSDITDGLSNTIFLSERPPHYAADLGWWFAGSGIDFYGTLEHRLGMREAISSSVVMLNCNSGFSRFQPGNYLEQCHQYHYWSYHNNGAWFAFGDTSVRFMPYTTDPEILVGLATRNGSEISQ